MGNTNAPRIWKKVEKGIFMVGRLISTSPISRVEKTVAIWSQPGSHPAFSSETAYTEILC